MTLLVMGRRIDGLTGLKGIGALVMLLFHFCEQYLPEIFSRDPAAYRSSAEKLISYTPLYITVNAQFFIAVFWGISGFLMAYLYYSNDSPQEMRRRTVKKYLYFLVPMLLSTLLSYATLKMGIIGSGGGWSSLIYSFEPDFWDAVTEAVYGAFMFGTANYNPVLWTMHVELIGSLLVLGWLAVWGKGRHRMLWWTAVCVMLYFYNSYYIPMIAGVVSADLYVNGHRTPNRAAISVFIVIAVFFGGMPFSNDLFGLYVYLPKWSGWSYYAMAIPCLLAAAINIKCFSAPVLVWLGKHSFPIYLFHFLVQCSVTERFYLGIVYRIPSYFAVLALTLCVHILVVIAISVIYTRMFEKWWSHVVGIAIPVICD